MAILYIDQINRFQGCLMKHGVSATTTDPLGSLPSRAMAKVELFYYVK